MGRQSSLIKITGKLVDHRFFKTKVGYKVRMKARVRGSRTSNSILVNVVDNKGFSGYHLLNVLL